MLCICTIQGSFIRNNQELPCQNCLFIEMGSMACYTETCPDCGRVPPSRSKEIKKYRDNLEKVILHMLFFFEVRNHLIQNKNNRSYNHISINLKYRRKSAAEVDLPPEDDMSTVPCPRSPKKSLGEVYIEKGLLPP